MLGLQFKVKKLIIENNFLKIIKIMIKNLKIKKFQDLNFGEDGK